MFTGIVEAKGRVRSGPPRLVVESPTLDLSPGDSIAVDGVCLTVVSFDGTIFAVDLSEETLRRSSLGQLSPGAEVNLERPLEAGGRFGGHFVQGHIDGVGQVRGVAAREGSTEMWIDVPAPLKRYMVEKGSVAVDGVSLTVAALDDGGFAVALIPFTLEETTLGSKGPGSSVNIEVDVIAKYVERLIGGRNELRHR